MKNKSRQATILLLVITVIVVAEAAAIAFFTTNLTDLRTEKHALQEISAANQLQATQLTALTQEYNNIEEQNIPELFNNSFPTDETFLDVIEELEEQGVRAGGDLVMRLGGALLTSEGIEVLSSSELNGSEIVINGRRFAVIEVGTVFRGDYAQTLNFFHYIDQMKYFATIDNVSWNRVQSVPSVSHDKIDTNMVISIYVDQIVQSNN